MHKTFLLALILVLSAAWLSAQNQPQTSPSQSPSPSTSASPSSTDSQSDTGMQSGSSTSSTSGNKIQGCLGGSSGNYTLTDNAGMTYRLSGDDSKLASHVGQEVEITGTSGSNGAGATSSGSQTGTGASAAGSSAGSEQTLTVEKVKEVSKTCKSASK